MHIELVCYGSPIKHKKFIEEVNTWEYPIEGKLRTGTCRPFVSEVKLYDVRILKEAAPAFLRDMEARNFEGMSMISGLKMTLKSRIIKFIIKLLRKLIGHEDTKPSIGPKLHDLPDWFYTFYIATIKDDTVKCTFTGEGREVL